MSVTQREIFEAIRLAAPPNERLAECLAYLLDDYHISRNITPFNTVAKSISADDLPNVDRMAVYILLTWAEMRPVRDSSVIQSVSSIVKYSTDDVTGNDCIALIIHFHAVCDSTPDTVICDSCYEWFICHNSTNKPTRKTLKDLLVMGKAVSGLMPPDQAPFQIIMFHEGYDSFCFHANHCQENPSSRRRLQSLQMLRRVIAIQSMNRFSVNWWETGHLAVLFQFLIRLLTANRLPSCPTPHPIGFVGLDRQSNLDAHRSRGS